MKFVATVPTQMRRRVVLAVLLFVSITVFISAFRLSKETFSFQNTTKLPKKPPSRFYQINNVTIDFAHASKDFEDNFIQYIRKASLDTTLSFHLYSHFNPINDVNSPNVTQLEDRQFSADILVVNAEASEEALVNTSSYLVFASSDFLNFTFQFVDKNRHWSHIVPPIMYIDPITRINLFHLQPPIVLLKRAGPNFKELIDNLWELQHPEDCNAVVKTKSLENRLFPRRLSELVI